MKHPMTLGYAQICPECDGHKRVICDCVPHDVDDVAEMVGAVGCPSCDGDGDHWCPACMGNGAIPRKPSCTCDENCDEPCQLCNRPTVRAARTAYRLGRKDARRYIVRVIGGAHTDSQTVDRFAKMIWSLNGGDNVVFEDLSQTCQTKMKMIAQEMLSTIGAAVTRGLDKAPDEPVNIEAIARAAEMSIFEDTYKVKMMPGQEPYSEDQLKRLNELMCNACEAEEEFELDELEDC